MLGSRRQSMGGSDARLEFSHRTPPRPRLLVGIGLLLLSLIGLLGHVTTLTASVSLCLAVLAATLMRSGIPRRETIVVDVQAGLLVAPKGQVALSELEAVELRTLPGDVVGHARPSYSAVALRSDGALLPLLECADPAELISLGRVLDGVVRVTVTWAPGHPTLGDWLESDGPGATLVARRVRGRAYARRRKASLVTWIVALGLGITWAYFLVRAERTPSLLSLSLAAISLAFALLTATLVTFDATLVTLGPTLCIERRVLGITVHRLTLPTKDILRAVALTPGGDGGHLLLVTRHGALSVPLAEPATHRVAELLSGT